jgi:hypothetical protein
MDIEKIIMFLDRNIPVSKKWKAIQSNVHKIQDEEDPMERERIAFDMVEISKGSKIITESEGAYQLGRLGFKEKELFVVNDMKKRYGIVGELIYSINKYIAAPINDKIFEKVNKHNL